MGYTGTYDGTIFHNPLSHYAVIIIKTDDRSIPAHVRSDRRYPDHLIRFTAVGYDLPLTDAVDMELEGEWVDEYYPPWEPPVSRFRATRKWYFPPSEPPQHIVAAHIFDFTINLLIVILGELLMQYHQIIYREVFLCLRRQKSEVFWNFWEKI